MIEQTELDNWLVEVYRYCSRYDIPVKYLVEIVSDPKVIPMIRGKAFEYSAMLLLRRFLPAERWIVDKVSMNAAFGFHDMDVRVVHIPTGKIVSVECKLAKKGGYRLKKGVSTIGVKCMRSRTLGPKMITLLANKTGIAEHVVAVHNDQYLPNDFDVVLTNIANAFYETEEDTGMYLWQPSAAGEEFLKSLAGRAVASDESLQNVAFEKVYVAAASRLAVTPVNHVVCSRRNCDNHNACGFIPNYPVVHFPIKNTHPAQPWYDLAESEQVFLDVIENKPTLRTLTPQQLQTLIIEHRQAQ